MRLCIGGSGVFSLSALRMPTAAGEASCGTSLASLLLTEQEPSLPNPRQTAGLLPDRLTGRLPEPRRPA